jgi:putative glutamine amidotransferase
MPIPIIGITQPSYLHYPRRLRENLARDAYYFAVRQTDGIPVEIIPPTSKDFALPDLKSINGILFSGGGDINPHLYGKEADELTIEVDDKRDAYELALFKLALENEIPFLGICRGLQLVNVVMGGSLFLDLSRERPSSDMHDWLPARQYLAHSISLEAGCHLSKSGYSTGTRVNSLHHQGIQELGKNLKPIAFSADGLVEAIELTGHRFGLAVQWHPEWLTDQQPARSLFNSFIEACG